MTIAKAQAVAHIRFNVPDIARITGFLKDFGFDVFERQPGRVTACGAGIAPFLYSANQAETAGFAAKQERLLTSGI